jgi:hypothetical protein
MKKTAKTAMTAAMFAASLGASANSACYANAIMQSNAAMVGFDYAETSTVGTTVQTVYGPPEVMESLFGTTTEDIPVQLEGDMRVETTNEDELVTDGVAPIYTDDENLRDEGVVTVETTMPVLPEGTVVTTTCTTTMPHYDTYPVPVYGPPSFFYKHGDPNMDSSIDVRDLSILKRVILEGEGYGIFDPELLDVNEDGRVNKEDIKALQRKLTGKPEDEDEQTTVLTGTTTTTTFTTTIDEPIPQPAYGPPEWFENDHDKYQT